MIMHWQRVSTQLFSTMNVPSNLQPWLTDVGSLVKRLRAHGAEPGVTVLDQHWGRAYADEVEQLGLMGEEALIREILIGEPGRSFVFARTVFPKATLTGEERVLGELGTRTLGSIIFQDPDLQRGAFEIACIEP